MARTKRKTYNARFKGRVAVEALREGCTVAEIASKNGVHSTLVSKWKQHALAGIPDLFLDGRTCDAKRPTGDDKLVRELYEQIGRLKMENEWLKKKLSR